MERAVRHNRECYELRSLVAGGLHAGMLVCLTGGRLVRRVVGRDGDDVILRGVRSTDIFEAVREDDLVAHWKHMVKEAR